MNPKFFLSKFLFLFILPTILYSQNGKIIGNVTDTLTSESLVSANIMVEGTSLGAATDLDGNFTILNVPEGKYNLIASYIGYQKQVISVLVQKNKTLEINFALRFTDLEGDEIVVTAQAKGQMEAVNLQLSANSIKNVVSSARIQEIPDANAAESVGRLPGVSILRSGGEGNKIVIRGLSPQYNAITINGVRMAATGNADRSSDLSMISPYMLEGIEVLKAITPDQEADVIGGTVNFKIREAPKELSYDVMAQGSYNGLGKTYNDYKFVAGFSNRFFSDKLGVFAQLDIENRNRSSEELGARYRLTTFNVDTVNALAVGNVALYDIHRERPRYGGTIVLDYMLPDGKINFTNFISQLQNKVVNRLDQYDLESNNHNFSLSDDHSYLTIYTNSLQFEQNISLLKLDAGFSYSFSETDSPEDLYFAWREGSAFTEIVSDVHPEQAILTAKNDLSNTRFFNISQQMNYNKETEISANLNLGMDFNLADFFAGNLKIGGKYKFKERKYDHNETYEPIGWGDRQVQRDAILKAFPWMQETVALGSLHLPYELFIQQNYSTGDNFLGGSYAFGPTANLDLMREIAKVSVPLSWSHVQNSIMNDYSGDETYYAGYIMPEFNFGTLIQFIPGLRYEKNKTEYNAIRGDGTQTSPWLGYVHTDTATIRENEYFLPMIHMKIKPLSWFDVRLAYTKTLARPNYNQITPAYNIEIESVSWNNFKLQPSRSENFDIYFSFYENTVGLFTIGGFYKEIKDLIFYTGRRAVLVPEEYGLPNITKGKSIGTFVNNQYPVKVQGFEIDWQHHMWYLPDVLKGIVFNINYTHIVSEAKYPRTIINTEYIWQPPWVVQSNIDTFYVDRMINQPDDILNLTIGYDYEGFSARISMLYSSNIFRSNNFWSELRGSTDDYLRWDVSLKQRLPIEGLQMFINLNNITEALDRNLMNGNNFPTSEERYGFTADFGIRYKL